MIYLDNSSTSFPKAPGVQDAILDTFQDKSGNPGRGGHRLARNADAAIELVRSKLKLLFNAPAASHCIFAANATDAIHLSLLGCLSRGETVISSPLIHNALYRPLYLLQQQGSVRFLDLEAHSQQIDNRQLSQILQAGVKMITVNHMSNVTGHQQDLKISGEIISHYPETLFMVDAAQSAGHSPLDMKEMNIDILIFTGHKGLYGPAGIGGMILSTKAARVIQSHRVGGSGANSEDPLHPQELPLRLEAGTPNTPGILGLGAGLDFIQKTGTKNIHQKIRGLSEILFEGLKGITDIEIFTDETDPFILSFRHPAYTISQWGALLDQEFDIACRTGLHCAPQIHKYLGTFPEGLVRLSPGFFNTEQDILETIKAIKLLSGH